MLNQAWHFQRPVLAQSYIKTLFTGVMLSTTVQAQPSTGLSSFLLRDVAPQAQDQGYVVAYVDLSDATVPVSVACIQGARLLLKGESLGRQSWRFLRSLFRGDAALWGKEWDPETAGQLGHDYYQAHAQTHALLFERLLEDVTAGGERILLIVDHAHELARDPIALCMAQALRNAITSNRNHIWPLYGSADMQRWHSVFQDPQSPLYSEGASLHSLPALGPPFVRQLCAQLGIGAADLDVNVVAQCFVQLGCRPQLLQDALYLWQTNPQMPLEQHVQQVLNNAAAARDNAR